MRQLIYSSIVLAFVAQAAYADTSPTEKRFNSFLQFVKDRDTPRHYILASKQFAIHKMLISECMQLRGFKDEASSDPDSWSKALNGEFGYCQDHHIPGIDPPCPAEDVVEASVNSSCWHLSDNQIDRSSTILHAAQKRAVAEKSKDPSDADIYRIEAAWSVCMASEGYQYQTRHAMYASYGNPDLSEKERASLPNHDVVMLVAEGCYEQTQYREKYQALFNTRSEELVANNRKVLFGLFERYEKAERDAEKLINHYCIVKRDQIVNMYNSEKFTEKRICENINQD